MQEVRIPSVENVRLQEIIVSFLPALKWTKENSDKESLQELMEWIDITITGTISEVSKEDLKQILEAMVSD